MIEQGLIYGIYAVAIVAASIVIAVVLTFLGCCFWEIAKACRGVRMRMRVAAKRENQTDAERREQDDFSQRVNDLVDTVENLSIK